MCPVHIYDHLYWSLLCMWSVENNTGFEYQRVWLVWVLGFLLAYNFNYSCVVRLEGKAELTEYWHCIR